MVEELARRPADLVQILLQPALQQRLPPGMREAVVESIARMMAGAIHPVFWTSVGLMLCGTIVARSLAARA